MNDSPRLNDELAPTAQSLKDFNDNNTAREGLDRLEQTMDVFGPAIDYIGPSQTVCNYWTILFRNLASAASIGCQRGPDPARFGLRAPNGTEQRGIAGGVRRRTARPTRKTHLHYNPYPNTAAPGQNPIECEAGNEPYIVGERVIGNVPGDQGTLTDAQLPSQLRRGER